jgi:hypothetical protein
MFNDFMNGRERKEMHKEIGIGTGVGDTRSLGSEDRHSFGWIYLHF